MEMLKTLIPMEIKRVICGSSKEDLPSVCSLLMNHLHSLPQYEQVVKELADPEFGLCGKDRESAMTAKQSGNECFRRGDYAMAVRDYSQALRLMPMEVEGGQDKNDTVATLFVNRASAMHKMGILEETVQDCNRAISLSPKYAKAWYRKGKANESLGNHEYASNDLKIALIVEKTVGGKCQIEAELEILKELRMKNDVARQSHQEMIEVDFCNNIELQELCCLSSPSKGRGMASEVDITAGCLLHSEEPYASVILKQSRDTHCHYCFVALPTVSLPCPSCRIAVYCSIRCLETACGCQIYSSSSNNVLLLENLPVELSRYISDLYLTSEIEKLSLGSNIETFPEHKHECNGVNWPAALPPEVVLAGRAVAKFVYKSRLEMRSVEPMKELDLCQHYNQMPGDSKLELMMYSVVLAHCLHMSLLSLLPLSSHFAAQLVNLLSQIKVNSMAIVKFESFDPSRDQGRLGRDPVTGQSLTCTLEQVKVGQGLYLKGSLFNHSCQPNIHAYFISRALFVRATENISPGTPLEICYGPQVGQHDIKERQQLLESQYSFRCQNLCCSELNFPDLVIHAFQCLRHGCNGVVLNHEYSLLNCIAANEKQKASVSEVAHLLLHEKHRANDLNPGCCLSCGTHRDRRPALVTVSRAKAVLERLQYSNNLPSRIVEDALGSLHVLRSIMHPHSKDVAQADDLVAEVLCKTGRPQEALPHCKASLEVIEKLYGLKHIAVANELVKLVSIYMSLNMYFSAERTVNRLESILRVYYGEHHLKMFPYLKKEIKSIPS